MKRERRPECPTPSKQAHRNLHLAEQVARLAAIRRNQHGQLSTPQYAYLCVCRRWHLTSWPTGPTGSRNVLVLEVAEDLQRWAITGSREDGAVQTGVLPLRSP